MEYIENYDDFGNDFDEVIINLQTDKYVSLKNQYKKIEELERVICNAFEEATKGNEHLIALQFAQIPMFKLHYSNRENIKAGVMDIFECSLVMFLQKIHKQVH